MALLKVRRPWEWLDRWVFHSILGVSLALNVYLGVRVRAAKPGVGQSPPVVATGTRATNLHAEELDGKKIVIDWAQTSKPSVLYVFSPSCVWCQRNEDNLETIVRNRHSDYRIV